MREVITAAVLIYDQDPLIQMWFKGIDDYVQCEGLLMTPLEVRMLILGLTKALEMAKDEDNLAQDVCHFGIGAIGVSKSKTA